MGLRYRASSVLKKMGDILLVGGELKAAEMAFRCAVRISADNPLAHLSLSALQHSGGKPGEARKNLERGIRIKPFYVRDCTMEPLARVLRVRGVQGSYYMIGKEHDGEFETKLRGGNISDEHLLDRSKYTIINYLILDDNILSRKDTPEFDIIVNMITDPDVEIKSLDTLAAFIENNSGIPVINRPEHVIKTTRDGNYRRLKGADGILFPRTVRLAGGDRGDVLGRLEDSGFSFPILARESGTHTGRTFEKLDDPGNLETYLSATNASELYLTQYVESLFRGEYFRKMRVFLIDGRLYPVVLHIDDVWNVHGGNRKEMMLKHPWMMDEEKAFMADCRGYLGARRHALLEGLHEDIGLDFFGIDFTLTGDGTILVYELNPTMRHSFDHARKFPYLTPYLENISAAFDRMLADRLGAPRTIT